MDYSKICNDVKVLAKSAGKFIRQEILKFSVSSIETKGKNDFVSYVDKETEKRLVEGLSKILPEAGFVAEEGTTSKKGEIYNWVVDPLDGTTNFIHGLSPHAVSIALMENDRVVVGVVYEVSQDECFYAWEKGGAYLNGKSIQVSKAGNISSGLIATGFPYANYDRIEPFMKSLEYFMKNSHGVRRLGSAATDLVYVACGRFEAFYEYGLSPWDVAAGAFIVQQAGGGVSDFAGEGNYIFGKEIVASNAMVFNEFLGCIKSFMA